MATVSVKGETARNALAKGVETVAACVKVTLGPKGRNVIINNNKWRYPTITNDGVTIAKSIDLRDKFANLGNKIIQQVADQTNEKVGDGTTTSIILAEGLVKAGLQNVEAGANHLDMLRGMAKAVGLAQAKLIEMATPIKNIADIKNVAEISSGSPDIGNLIAEAYSKVGYNGVIQLEDGRKGQTYLETINGIKFNKGYISPLMINTPSKDSAVLEDPLILVTDDRISYIYEVMAVLEKVMASQRPILIICEDIAVDLLTMMLQNIKRKTMDIVVVTCPGYGDRRKAYLEDIATLTGATVVAQQNGIRLEDASSMVLGSAKKVVVDKTSTTIVEGGGDQELIAERAAIIKAKIDDLGEGWTKEKLLERYGWLVGGIATIKVGGATDPEALEEKYRIEDALNSAKDAIKHGTLPGGGIALYQVGKDLTVDEITNRPEAKDRNYDEELGFALVVKALTLPLEQLAINCGKNPEEIKLAIDNGPAGFGYDAKADTFVDMMSAGIIDAARISVEALQNAFSIASLVIDSHGLIAYVK